MVLIWDLSIKLNKIMKKIKLTFFLVLLSAFVSNAQKSISEKNKLIEKAEKLLSDYKQYASFSQLDKNGFSDETASKFKLLFTNKAEVFDNLVTGYFDNELEFPRNIRLKSRKVDDYIAKTKEVFPNGIKAVVTNVTANYYGLNNNNFNFVLIRKYNAYAKNDLAIECIDTVLMRCKVIDNGEDIKISEIFSIGYTLNFTNDRDKDYVFDQDDNCPSLRGIKENKGCPKNDGPNMFITPVIAYGFNSFSFNGPTQGNLGYSDYVVGSSKFGEMIQNKSNNNSTISIGAEFEYYFRWQRQWGIGFGAIYQTHAFSTELADNVFRAEYKGIENTTNTEYRRMISVNALSEANTMSNLLIPFFVKYKKHLSTESKFWLNLDLGVAFNLFLNGSSNGSSNMNYDAAYNYENGGFVYKGTTSVNELIVSREELRKYFTDKYGNSQTAKGIELLIDAEYEKRKREGYDVGTNENINKTNDFTFNSSIALIIKPAITYEISKKLLLVGGVIFTSTTHTNSNSINYKLSDKVGEYNTLMNGTSAFTLNATSLFFGTKIVIN